MPPLLGASTGVVPAPGTPPSSASSARLRILHLGKYYPPVAGGMETHVRHLARAQASLGADVTVLCFSEERRTTREQDGDVSVVRMARVAQVAKLDLCPGLVDEVASIRADVIHVHVPNPVMLLALLVTRAAAPIVATYHSDHVRQRVRGALFRPLERLAFRRVSRILATSPPYAESSEFLRAQAHKVTVVPLGIDPAPFLEPSVADRRTAEELRARNVGPLWVGCGRLTYYKGLDVAIRALAQVPGTLLLVGEGPERPRLEALARESGVVDRVVFAGNVPSVVPYFLAALALWFPSNARSEAYGLVQLEAMAAGCPVINTAIPGSGVPWVSPHLETGVTIPVGSVDALALAARRLLDEPSLRVRLGEAARQRARSFDLETSARRTLDVYESVLGRTRR